MMEAGGNGRQVVTVYLFSIILVRDAQLRKVDNFQLGQHVRRVDALPGKGGHRVTQPDAIQPVVHEAHAVSFACDHNRQYYSSSR